MKAVYPLLVTLCVMSSCKQRTFGDGNDQGESSVEAVNEPQSWYGRAVNVPASTNAAFPLSGDKLEGLLDIRGVGDSAWASIKQNVPAPSKMGFYLKQFDPTREILKGDLNFMNFESTVHTRCNAWYPVDFAFLAHPNSVAEAAAHGFNLFGVANNHTEDCQMGGSQAGALYTRDNMNVLAKKYPFMWHGAGQGQQLNTPVTKTFDVKGRKVVVAFASVAFQSWATDYTSRGESHGATILKAMRESKADIKILAIHTQGKFDLARELAADFVQKAGGDVVFQHGPHTWAGVKVVKKPNGKRGILFNGLGNFIHSGCSDNPDNLVGRALFNLQTLELVQVQVVPVINHFNAGVSLRQPSSRFPISNVNWSQATLKAGRNVPIGFANVTAYAPAVVVP